MKKGNQFQILSSEVQGRFSGVISMVGLLAIGLAAMPAQGGTNFTTVASFGTASFGTSPGLNPLAEMTQTPDGMFYGTTESGGANGAGAVFRLGPLPATPTANGLTPVTIASLGGTNGIDPRGPLTLGPDGNLYGTTYAGGSNGLGTIFVVTTNGLLTTLASFNGNNGAGPRGAVVFNTNANGSFSLYGTTYAGGVAGNNGTLFRFDLPNGPSTNAALTGLVSFDGPTYGAQPWGGLTMGSDGNLYGTTANGGSSGGGTVFMYEIPLTGYAWGGFSRGMNALYYFSGTDGTNSQASLVVGPDGQTLYGTSFKGGTNNGGTIFSVSPMTNYTAVTVSTLWNFGTTAGSGSNCAARLLVGADNNLYGTTQYGGANNWGTIFSCNTNGSFALLASFTGGSKGYWPLSGLVQSPDGNFYGVTKYGGTALNSQGTVYELWGFPPYIVSLMPTNLSLTIVTNASDTLSVSAGGTAPLTYQWRKNSSNIGNSSAYSGVTTTNLTITAGKSTNTYSYSVVVKNSYGAATSSVIQVTTAYSFGTNVPTVKITSPSLNKQMEAQTTSLNVKVSGTALADTLTTVSTVYYSINGSPPQPAPQTTKGGWTASVTLTAGTNIFQFYAEDNLGHFSLTNTAYLIPSLFVPVAGSYNGLFLNTNSVVAVTNAGFFNISVTTAGSFSGKLMMGGGTYSMSGKLDPNGQAQATAKNGKVGLLVTMWLDLTTNSTGRILGFISNSNNTWEADLAGDLSVFDGKYKICPWAGKFNYALSGTNLTLDLTNLTLAGTNFSITGPSYAQQPSAGSYATITVSTAGKISLSGFLSDGTTFSTSVPIARNGLWPFYASLYSGQGMVWSWQSFPTNPVDSFRGDVAWIKPPTPKAKYYANGFTLRSTPMGSYYAAPTTGQNVFGSPATNDATLVAIEGNLSAGITNPIAISPKNQVSNLGTDVTKLSLSFSTSVGTFSGNFTPTGTKTVTKFKGVVLENTNSTGFFLGTNESGQVWITIP